MYMVKLFVLIFCIHLNTAFAQTIKPKSFIVSTLVPDNVIGRYNLGGEYFLDLKDKNKIPLLSIALNAGKVNTTIFNEGIKGFDIKGEANVYGPVLMSDKWNEYVGFKLAYGKYKNEKTNQNNTHYFIGLGTGIQPILLKIISIKLSTDIGYIRNALSNTTLLYNKSQPLHSGFAMIFNLGVGVKF